MDRVRVLAVDDSALMRRYLRESLPESEGFQVLTARNGEEALAEIRRRDPDVVTLDVNMPQMDGVTCLSRIMVEVPRPVVMVSSLTEEGALVTLEALELGAVDYIPKPGGTVSRELEDLGPVIRAKVRAAARARPAPAPAPPSATAKAGPASGPAADAREKDSPLDLPPGLVLVGVSTGGPRALESFLPRLPADFPFPVVVAQHIGEAFTRLLAERLDGLCSLGVREVSGQTPLRPGEVALGRGDRDLLVGRRANHLVALLAPPDSRRFQWHPSVDRLVWSALAHIPAERTVGVQLTGMGHDGVSAFTDLYRGGGHTIAESEETAVVYGMPRELVEEGGAEMVRPIQDIGDQVARWAREDAPCP